MTRPLRALGFVGLGVDPPIVATWTQVASLSPAALSETFATHDDDSVKDSDGSAAKTPATDAERSFKVRQLVCGRTHTFAVVSGGLLLASGNGADGVLTADARCCRWYSRPTMLCLCLTNMLLHVTARVGRLGFDDGHVLEDKWLGFVPVPHFCERRSGGSSDNEAPRRVRKVAVGAAHSIVLDTRGIVWGCGYNKNGVCFCLCRLVTRKTCPDVLRDKALCVCLHPQELATTDRDPRTAWTEAEFDMSPGELDYGLHDSLRVVDILCGSHHTIAVVEHARQSRRRRRRREQQRKPTSPRGVGARDVQAAEAELDLFQLWGTGSNAQGTVLVQWRPAFLVRV